MTGAPLGWIDWKLRRGTMAREAGGRFALLLFLAVFFQGLVLSRGVNRLLSEQWAMTAVMNLAVPAAEGEGIAASLRKLPAVRSAVYKDPEAAWKEFVASYPGLESLKTAGGNPLPGYVEVRMRPDRLTEADISYLASVLRPLPQVEKLLSGGDSLPMLLRLKGWANGLLWTVFAILCVAFLSVLGAQERARAASLRPDLAFLQERGVSSRRIAWRRAAVSAATGAFLAAAASAAAVVALYALAVRFPQARLAIGGPAEIGTGAWLLPGAAYVVMAAVAAGGASLLGWRQASSAAK